MNCKPGDYAFLRGLDKWSEFNGRVVQVIAWNAEWSEWQVEPQFAQPKHGGWDTVRNFFCADENLLPITGDPVDEDVTEDLKEPA